MNHRFDLSGRVALVTGGSRGLGREMVLAFAEAGADVVIASRKLASCEELARSVEERFGRRALAYACNVSNWEELEGLSDAAHDHFGKIDILVNNAGGSPLYDHVSNLDHALWQKVIDLNLTAPFRLSSLVGAKMLESGGGSIIMVSSVAAIDPGPDTIPYAAAKAGLNNMTTGLARTFGPSVRVNCIMPGMFRTDISKAWDMKAVEESARASLPLQRIGEPNEIVGAALYLASDASSYTTGAVLPVTGGH